MIELLKADKVVATTKAVTNDIMTGNTHALERMGDNAIEWCVAMGKNIVIALAIFFIGRYVIKAISKLVAKMMIRRNVEPSIQSFVNSFISITLMVLLVITVISTLGINTTSFAALLASAGVAVGMALSGNLQNFAGGLIILLLKPYKVGEYIEAQGQQGTVKSIQIFHTVIQTLSGRYVFLPNGAMSSGTIVNWHSKGTIRVERIIGIEYGEDTEKARRVILDICKNTPYILESPAPVVHLDDLAASSVNLKIWVWVHHKDYWKTYFTLPEDIYKAFNREGIGFPFPQLTVHNAKD